MNTTNPARGLFITGTDTEVGKTYVTSMIARELVHQGRNVGAYKPACSGADFDANGKPVWNDVEELSRAIGGGDLERISPQRFEEPMAPPVAAVREEKIVDPHLLRTGAEWWMKRVEILLVEGVGGLLCPLTENETVADLAADLGFPIIIVARLGLGTINHTLLTVEVARQRGLAIAGIVLNEGWQEVPPHFVTTNATELARRCPVPQLGILRRNDSHLTRNDERTEIDWWSLAREGKAIDT